MPDLIDPSMDFSFSSVLKESLDVEKKKKKRQRPRENESPSGWRKLRNQKDSETPHDRDP